MFQQFMENLVSVLVFKATAEMCEYIYMTTKEVVSIDSRLQLGVTGENVMWYKLK